MSVLRIDLFKTFVNNIGTILPDADVDYSRIKAYALDNGLLKEFELAFDRNGGAICIKDEEVTLGYINEYTDPFKKVFSVGLLMEFEEIQLSVEIPYGDKNEL